MLNGCRFMFGAYCFQFYYLIFLHELICDEMNIMAFQLDAIITTLLMAVQIKEIINEG